MKYIVYQTVNKENGKLYIGVHKTKNPDIFDGYIGNGIYVGYSLENPKTVYQHALKKYGYNSFIRTTLKTFDNEEDAYDYEAKLVTLEFIKQDNNYNIKTGGIHGNWNFKNVYQFNYEGTLIKTWTSVNEVIEYYSCNPNRISMAVSNKYSAFESYWSFFDTIDITEYKKSKHSELYQFDEQGTLLKVYNNSITASKELNINIDSLNEAVSKKKKFKNCYWTKNPDNIINIIKINNLYNLRNKAIIQLDKNKNPIQEFINITKASEQLNIKYETIKSAINKESLVDNKYYFKYVSIIKPTKQKVGQYDLNTGQLIKIWDSITDCAKIHPKCRDVIKGGRRHTHGYTFNYIND